MLWNLFSFGCGCQQVNRRCWQLQERGYGCAIRNEFQVVWRLLQDGTRGWRFVGLVMQVARELRTIWHDLVARGRHLAFEVRKFWEAPLLGILERLKGKSGSRACLSAFRSYSNFDEGADASVLDGEGFSAIERRECWFIFTGLRSSAASLSLDGLQIKISLLCELRLTPSRIVIPYFVLVVLI